MPLTLGWDSLGPPHNSNDRGEVWQCCDYSGRFNQEPRVWAKYAGLGVGRVRGFGLIRNGRAYLIMFNIGLRVGTAKSARDGFS